MNKRGQIYLIAAMIIIVIIISLTATANYIITKPKPTRFYDMSKWLGDETYRVIDYSIVKDQGVSGMIQNFTEEYFVPYMDSKDKLTGMLFVYGDYENVRVVDYKEASIGSIKLTIGGTGYAIDVQTPRKYESIIPTNNQRDVDITIGNSTYNFKLNKGENFIFLIKKCEEKECYVASS